MALVPLIYSLDNSAPIVSPSMPNLAQNLRNPLSLIYYPRPHTFQPTETILRFASVELRSLFVLKAHTPFGDVLALPSLLESAITTVRSISECDHTNSSGVMK